MSDSPVRFELADEIAVIHLDDGKVNALTYPAIDGLMEALARASREASATVLVGRPGRFSAGFDLKQMTAGPSEARALVSRGAELLLGAYAHPQPLVVACTGHAIAAGALLLLTADVRVGCTGDFKLGLNEVAIGMPLPVLAIELARDRIAPRRLTEATLGARMYGPDEAAAVGYLDQVVEPDALLDTALEHARRLAKLNLMAFAASKQVLRRRTIGYIRDTLEESLRELGV